MAAAAAIVTALRAGPCPNACLDIVGRTGWGEDAKALAAVPGVTLHGYLPVDEIRALVAELLLWEKRHAAQEAPAPAAKAGRRR